MRLMGGDIRGPTGSGMNALAIEERALNDVLGDRSGGELDEIASFHGQRGLEVHLGALDRGGQHSGWCGHRGPLVPSA